MWIMANGRLGQWLQMLVCVLILLKTEGFYVGITYVQNAIAKEAVCLDGSPPTYHLDKGFGAGINNWLVHFEGGGWCNNVTTCLARKNTRLGSSKQMANQLAFSGLLSNLQKFNLDFYNWNRIKVMYCDGSSFTGDVEAVNPATNLHFRGARIFAAVIEDLLAKGMKNAANAIISGGSAGGLTSILHCDCFRALLPIGTKVKCLSDAGYFINTKDVSGTQHIEAFYNDVVTTHGELMAERAVISVIQYLGTLLAGEVELLRGVRKEMVSIKAELKRIHSFLKDAESRAKTGDEGAKIWVKQVRQVAYTRFTRTITKLKPQHEIASQIQDIKTTIREIKEGADRYGFHTSTSSEHSSTSTSSITKDNMWRDPRLASLFIGDDEVVAVISVVGMGGIGKTTLAKKIYESQEVVAHFNCKVWITVSQSYKPEELLKKMIKQLSGNNVLPDEGIESLIDKLRRYLSEKRYVIVFDDVWETDFWGSIRRVLPKNSDGSRVIITTHSEQVATFCKETSMDHVHELEALSEEKAWEPFCKKAFQLDFEGHCPPELEEVSHAIVRKCQGLALAIATIGGLLSTKNKGISKWKKFYGGMNSELERNPDLKSISKILLFSYNDLPHHLKSCFLYFGIIPEDYSIKAGRLIRLWIAEGFVKEQNGKTLEEVHDVVREIILSLSKEFSLCQILERENSSFNATTRRLSMHMHYRNMDKVMKSISKSPVRSVFLFQWGELPKKPLLGTVAANFKLLKVLDLEDAPLDQLHEEVGNLFLLRYLSIRSTGVEIIPKSIGKLQNLQTLDLKDSHVSELPFEISRLCKLRHLLAYSYDFKSEYMGDLIIGVKIQGGIGGLEELQSLWIVETNHGLIKELEKLRQLRKLGIRKLERQHERALCAAIEKMKYLQHLSVMASKKLLDWIPKVQNLAELSLVHSSLTKNDPLKALQVLPSLARLQLTLVGFKGLNSVIIEEGALPLSEHLTIEPSPQLKEVPSGIHHLINLKTLQFVGMPEEFIDRMEPKPNQGKDYWIIEHIPEVKLSCRTRKQGPIGTDFGSLQDYFNRKVKNARVREDKNESPSLLLQMHTVEGNSIAETPRIQVLQAPNHLMSHD
ncbi:unnamed protein product [Camellia sinensis]